MFHSVKLPLAGSNLASLFVAFSVNQIFPSESVVIPYALALAVGIPHSVRESLEIGVTASGYAFGATARFVENAAGIEARMDNRTMTVSIPTAVKLRIETALGFRTIMCRTRWPSYGPNKSVFK